MSILLSSGEAMEKKSEDFSIAFFRLAFRPFFLLGSLFSIISLLIWSAVFTESINVAVYGGHLWWHIHEMLFGFVSAIVVGFLLTAVQNWTCVPGIKGSRLMLLVLLWISARVLFFLPFLLPHWLIYTVDLLFLPVTAFFLARPIIQAKLWRNLIFIPILLAMTYTNAAMHYSSNLLDPKYMLAAGNAMVLIITLLICVIGGRVIPMFTANGTNTEHVPAIQWLEIASIASMLLLVVSNFGIFELPSEVNAALFLLAASIHFIRVWRWRIWVTFKTPLVWSLHLGYWCIPVGLLLLAVSELSDVITHSQALHTLTVGTIAVMILAMISRVSLGHTGRNIEVGKLMAFAFLAIFLAFIVRVFGVYWLENYQHVIVTAAILWGVGYGCFVVLFIPVLTRPRIDGRAG